MNKACNSFHSPRILLAPPYPWPQIFWTSRLWWDKTKDISFLRVEAVVSLTWTISKNHSRINPLLSTNLTTTVICSLLDSSWASSTIKQNFASPISWRIEDWTFLAKTCKISFWIWCEVYLEFYGALSKIKAPTCSLYDAKSSNISRKLPRFFDSGRSSGPLRAHAWNVS